MDALCYKGETHESRRLSCRNCSLAVADLEVSTLHPVCRVQRVTAQEVHGRRDSLAATRTLFLNAVALKQFSGNVPLNLSSSDPLWRERAGAARQEKGLVDRHGSTRDGEGSRPRTQGCEFSLEVGGPRVFQNSESQRQVPKQVYSFGGRSGERKPRVSKSTSPLEQLKDEVFEETEKNFRMQERLIKSFIRDLSLYLQHIRVSVDVAVVRDSLLPFTCSPNTLFNESSLD